jgi:hypothetical protein
MYPAQSSPPVNRSISNRCIASSLTTRASMSVTSPRANTNKSSNSAMRFSNPTHLAHGSSPVTGTRGDASVAGGFQYAPSFAFRNIAEKHQFIFSATIYRNPVKMSYNDISLATGRTINPYLGQFVRHDWRTVGYSSQRRYVHLRHSDFRVCDCFKRGGVWDSWPRSLGVPPTSFSANHRPGVNLV